MEENWRIWDNEKEYGDIFYKRASGAIAEMESSKAIAKHVQSLIRENDLILDVGCGAGHYLVSLDKNVKIPFSYYGIDATSYYIQLAKKAFQKKNNTNPIRKHTNFKAGDIYCLQLADKFADIVMCNNVLQHLPSIKKPIEELWRVTKKYLIIRTLSGKTSFRIKQINPPENYTEDGEPLNFHYFNIYSEQYIETIINNLANVKKFKLIIDNNFNPDNIGEANYKVGEKPYDLTTIVNGMQVNNYIIQPWQFLIIEKKHENS